MAAITNYELGNNSEFRNKVESLLKKVATQIQGEEPTVELPQVAVTKRAALCNEIFRDFQRRWEAQFSMTIASLGTLTLLSDDNDIEFTIVSVFSDMAGVTYADLNP